MTQVTAFSTAGSGSPPRARGDAPALPETWRAALAGAVRDPDELIALLGLPEGLRAAARRAARLFPLVVPRSFIARMRRGDPADPLLLQVLPSSAEDDRLEGYTEDPVGDGSATIAPGLIRKYEGRALLVASGVCAVHCRYCFRRHFPYGSTPRGAEAWAPALRALREDGGLREIILSGGDPLVLPDDPLARLVGALEEIPHLRRLRVHTRLPIVVPERVTDRLVALLRGSRLTPIVVVHANHPAELAGGCPEALGRLVDAGIPVLNQAVLLRGVNDDDATLASLCDSLATLRVRPYYLHQLDRVAGAAHFAVSEGRGREIVAALRRRLPGYAVPQYVREVPGAPSKVPIAP